MPESGRFRVANRTSDFCMRQLTVFAHVQEGYQLPRDPLGRGFRPGVTVEAEVIDLLGSAWTLSIDGEVTSQAGLVFGGKRRQL